MMLSRYDVCVFSYTTSYINKISDIIYTTIAFGKINVYDNEIQKK